MEQDFDRQFELNAPSVPLTHSVRRKGFGLTIRLVGLAPREALLSARGFKVATPQARQALEAAGAAFIRGYNQALQVRDVLAATGEAVSPVGRAWRGFFMEGAAMGFAVRDAMPWHLLASSRLPLFLGSVSASNPYLPTVGAGWAMARLPWRRTAILSSLDRLLAPLALDGWGFHDCYFNPNKFFRGPSRQVERLTGDPGARSWDQGAGRALWFISGGCIAEACALIARVAPSRHADLFAGLGLAITYAGGIGAEATKRLRSTAGPFRRDLAQGSAFALEAHVRALTDTPAVIERAESLIGIDAASAITIVRSAMPIKVGELGKASNESWELYERWRTRVANELEILDEVA
ncbi:DUF1702 family protein [Sinorhizobium meliloti]|uniref:DUF1702 family protein n=1 Tax=Rhizobium meliloti TaxID=382 RepID=UPI0012FD8CF8|nr:DUF1702 family protein [Sinorhizobium meliloti]MDE3858114.1 DUF1702 family protein [Sinorhizobium meliloti]